MKCPGLCIDITKNIEYIRPGERRPIKKYFIVNKIKYFLLSEIIKKLP